MTVEVISPAYDVLDERFLEVRGDERVDSLYDGCRWAEGPCYLPAGRYLLFNDIPEDRMLRWDETTGAVGVFRQPSGYANGNTLDRQGRLVTCEQGRGASLEPSTTAGSPCSRIGSRESA